MKEVKIFVDGKEVESIEKLVEMFINLEVPEQYKSVDDYLSLKDLNITKITDIDKYNDFSKKIMNRIKFAREHKDYLSLTFNYDKMIKSYSDDAKIHDLLKQANNLLAYYYTQLKEIKNQK